MINGTPPTTTSQASKVIARDLDINEDVVRMIVDAFMGKVMMCLKAEMPFSITGFGKFYHRYGKNTQFQGHGLGEYYKDKVHKHLTFQASDTAKSQLNGFVHDMNIKTNLPKELARIAIRPDEIEKVRRRQVLEDQRQLGFRAELLFDEGDLPHHDRTIMRELGEAPSIDQIAEQIGLNVQND